MKSVAALALLASTAAAFAPAQESRASTSLAAFEDALGAQKPLGFWYVYSFALVLSLLMKNAVSYAS